ncbi:hypothetical protein [Pseudonocardia sp. NPDC049154]|uniref:hypothetical protein n=1 Tax=Pseudonocardia sp. NPDC049154 TaxID=3155501 RepID=UPI003402F0C3
MKVSFYTVLQAEPPAAPKFATRESAAEFARLNGGAVFPVVDVQVVEIPINELRVLEVDE